MKYFGITLFISATLLFASEAYSQVATGDILGSVTDESGAIIIGANVKATNLGTQGTRIVKTGDSGEFVFSALQNGHYSISITASGFKSFNVPDLALSAGDRARVIAKLEVGQASETVQVSGIEPALQTDSSTLSTMATVAQLQDLPLNGRDYFTIAQTAAGATEGPPNSLSSGTRPDDRRMTSAISVNGQSDSNNNELIDGVDNNERVIGTTGVRPSVDAIAEFRVQTNTYPAEVGRTAGGVINIISKSGSNDYHGSVYEFLRNNVLDSRDFFAQSGPSPEYRQNQFGASLGGPVRKNKTFFFGDYEGLRIVEGTTYTTTVPTLFEEENPGNLSDTCPSCAVLSSTEVNPIALKYFELYPKPTSTATINNFTFSPNKTQFSNISDVRLDHHFNDNDELFGRYSYNNVSTFTPGALPSVGGTGSVGISNIFPGQSNEGAQNIVLKYTHLFSSTVLEATAGYTRVNILDTSLNSGQNLSQDYGLANVNVSPQTTGLSTMQPIGYATLGDGIALPLNYIDNTFQYSGALTNIRGKHTIKLGASLVQRRVVAAQNQYGLGEFYFAPLAASLPPLESFFEGIVYQVVRWNELYRPEFRTWEPTVYAQDDWRVTSTLTLNLGLRYDVYTPFTEAHNRMSTLDPSSAVLLVAGQSGVSDSANIQADYKDIAPRLGFAASLRPGTVLRGGYGMTFYPDDTGFPEFLQNTPYAVLYDPNPLTTGLSSTALPVMEPASTGVLAGAYTSVSTSRRKAAYFYQFNLNVEQEFKGNVVTIGYVGELGHRLQEMYNANLAPPDTSTTAPLQSRRAYYNVMPNVTTIERESNFGYAKYNALQMQIERRLSHGLSVNANYTVAHAFSNTAAYAIGSGTEGSGAVPSEISTLDYGNSDLDVRQRVTAQIGYELPFGANRHGLRGIVAKGWQVNALNVWETGMPFTIVNAEGQSNTGVTTDGDRPDQIASARISNPSISEFFNTAAFAAQPFGTIGNVRKDSLYGPHFRHLDTSVFKTFDMAHALKLEFRAEFFNLTNTPNFASPNGELGNPTFGTINSTLATSTPRQIQFALKLLF